MCKVKWIQNVFLCFSILQPFIKYFISLISGLKDRLSDHTLTSTYTIGSDIKAYHFPELSKFYDLVTILHSYNKVNSTSDALKARDFNYITKNIDTLISMGVPASKIVLGLPYDSPKFITTLSTSESRFSELVDYNTICRLLSSNNGKNWHKSFDSDAGLAIAQSKQYLNDEIYSIVFESSRSIANKLRFAMKQGLSGAMTDLIHKDDIHGKCEGFDSDIWSDFKPVYGWEIPERNDSTLPLLKSINEAIEVTLDEMHKDELVETNSDNLTKVVYTFLFIVLVLISVIFLMFKWKKLRVPITFCTCAHCFRAKTINYHYYSSSADPNIQFKENTENKVENSNT